MTIEQHRARSSEEAIAERAARTQKAKWAYLVTFAGLLVAGFSLYSAVLSFSFGALIFLLLGLGALVGGFVVARRRMADVRYWISEPFGPVVAALKIVGLLAVFAGIAALATALGAPKPLGVVLIGALAWVLAWTIQDHAEHWTAFQADLVELRFGRTVVPWPAIAAFVVANGARPDTVEIGIRTKEGTEIVPAAVGSGGVLGDLPVHAVVPAAKFRWERLRWAVTESGRRDVVVLVRTVDGEHPAPADGWPRH